MPVQFIGFIGSQYGSEIHPARGPVIDLRHIEETARVHEDGGFDRALVAFGSSSPESILIAQHALAATSKLGLMIAHRPGFTQPTLAARQLATLDHLSGGRVAVHIITGGADEEMHRDGDVSTKADRYARTDEYLEIVRKEWTADKPFDFKGQFYDVAGGFASVKPLQKPHIPIFFGGSSDEAIPVAGRHADIFALWGETHDQVREQIARIRAAAARAGREVEFSLSLRPVLAETEEAAWARAEDIEIRVRARREASGLDTSAHAPPNAGSQRLLQAVAQGKRLDKRLWTGVAGITGARGNSTGLVGTPDQVADALLDYYELGIRHFLIRGFDPFEDAVAYGRDLIPRVKALVAEHDAKAWAAAS